MTGARCNKIWVIYRDPYTHQTCSIFSLTALEGLTDSPRQKLGFLTLARSITNSRDEAENFDWLLFENLMLSINDCIHITNNMVVHGILLQILKFVILCLRDLFLF